jgi:hypothetical protein
MLALAFLQLLILMSRSYPGLAVAGRLGLVLDDDARGPRAVRRPLTALPLRVRLMAVACCAVAVCAGCMCLACRQVARSALGRQAEQQLRNYAGLLASRPFLVRPAGPGPAGAAGGTFVVEVVSASQLVIRTSAGHRPGPVLADVPARAGQVSSVPAGAGAGRWLVVTRPVHYIAKRILFTYGSDGFFLNVTSPVRPGSSGTLVVGLDLRGVGQAVRNITITIAAVGCALMLLIALAVLAASRAILRPLARMAQDAAGVIRFDDAKLSTDVARTRTEQMREVMIGACRDMRRPLSVIRGSAEYYVGHAPLTGPELHQMMGRIAGEVARMDAVVDGLAAAGDPEAGDPERNSDIGCM